MAICRLPGANLEDVPEKPDIRNVPMRGCCSDRIRERLPSSLDKHLFMAEIAVLYGRGP
jgi:hypothetical protein